MGFSALTSRLDANSSVLRMEAPLSAQEAAGLGDESEIVLIPEIWQRVFFCQTLNGFGVEKVEKRCRIFFKRDLLFEAVKF